MRKRIGLAFACAGTKVFYLRAKRFFKTMDDTLVVIFSIVVATRFVIFIQIISFILSSGS
jgi:hypothetical protein